MYIFKKKYVYILNIFLYNIRNMLIFSDNLYVCIFIYIVHIHM